MSNHASLAFGKFSKWKREFAQFLAVALRSQGSRQTNADVTPFVKK